MKVGFPCMQLVNLEDIAVVKCTVCSSIFFIASFWRTSITDHLQAKEHKNILLAKFQSGSIKNYFCKLEKSKGEQDLAVYEGSYVRHTVLHKHSFRNMDCTTSLQKKIAFKKLSCGRRNCESIVAYVYTPWALGELTSDLKHVNSVTLSCDASNHKHVKQLPILVHYFQTHDLENPAKKKLFTPVEISRETADIISVQVIKAIANYNLRGKDSRRVISRYYIAIQPSEACSEGEKKTC
jgi:hypothetical protein